MKKFFRLAIFIFLFSSCLYIPDLSADLKIPFLDVEPDISMDFQDANLKDILKILSIQSGLNFIASEAVKDRKITLYLNRVPLKKAMDELFKANNLSYELNEDSSIFIVKDWGTPQIETVTKVFYLKYATVSTSSLKTEMSSQMQSVEAGTETGRGKWSIEDDTGITKAVKKLLSEAGSVIEDFRTNSLIVTDTPNRMPIIAQVIASLDVPAQQVMLEVEMLDVSKNIVDKMGFDFSGAGSFAMQVLSASMSTGFPLKAYNPSIVRAATTFTPGAISFPTTLKLVLDFLRTQTDTKFLARPRLLTLNNETAEIRISTNESIGVKTTTTSAGGSLGTSTAEAERFETGVVFRVTPQINAETGEITMFVYPKVSEAVQGTSFTTGGSTYQFRDPEERSTKSLVRLKDGETVVIGGLIRNEFSQVQTKIPILGDIPLIGALFRHKGGTSDKNKERELLVFITPHIIKDTDMRLAQEKEIKLPEREQNTFSAVGRALEINASLNNFEKKQLMKYWNN